MVEPALPAQRFFQSALAGMAERWVADIMRQAQGLGQILVQPQSARDRPPDLRHLQTMGQPHAEMITIGGHEHLRLVAQATKADRMDDAVAVALKRIARPARGPLPLVVQPPTAARGIAGIAGKSHRKLVTRIGIAAA
jgi:hypothetical protein